MDRRRCLTFLFVRLVVVGSLIVMSATSCATEQKPMRPLPPGIRFDATGLEYIYTVPADQAYETVLEVLRSVFTISFAEKENQEKLEQFHRYGEVVTEYLHYREQGKKYRKKCNAYVRLIPGYPNYSNISTFCEYDVYELGLIHGRGGIHNLFTQWWDWYPETRVYVAEDMFELIRQKIVLSARPQVIFTEFLL